MKHLKLFETKDDYQAFINSDRFVTPNISMINNEGISYHPHTKIEILPNRTITYTASDKLVEVSGSWVSGLHTDTFNCPIVAHEFANGVGTIIFEDDVTTLGKYSFDGCTTLTSIVLPETVVEFGDRVFNYCSNLSKITINAIIAPVITRQTFNGVKEGGELIYPEGSDYSEWLRTDSYYLGYYGWK